MIDVIDPALATLAVAIGMFNLGFMAGGWWFARGSGANDG